MAGFKNKRSFHLFLLTMIITLLAGMRVGVAASAETTYIEFIFDASFSMKEDVEKGKSRMDVAKEVMIDLIQNLEDRPGLEVGLRVYGSRNTECDDSILVQDFGPVNAVRGNILDVVRSLKPKGKTPIAYSLEQAAHDFPNRDSRNIIVLITDGQESCGGDPCAVSYYLQAQGIIYKPHVVGFAMSASEEAKVSCIGTYYSAKDRKSLSEALGSIMRKVVQPSTLEIEAWAGGQNVTSQTVFQITDASGDVAGGDLKSKGDSLTRSFTEGVYTVKGTFKTGTMVLEAVQSGIKLGEGESKRVRLDFGDLVAKLEVDVTYRGANITKDTRLQITRRGEKEASYGTGSDIFRHEGAAGEVDLKVTYMGPVSVDKNIRNVNLDQGKTTRVTVNFDDILGTLRVKVKAGNKDVTLQAETTAESSEHKLQLAPRGEQLVAIIPADLYGVRAIYQKSKSDLAEVTVRAGEITDVTLQLDVPGRVVLLPIVGDKPAPLRKVEAWFYRTPGQETAFQAQDDRLVASMGAGTYGIRAKYNGVPVQMRTIENLEVRAGETQEVKVVFEPVSRFRVKLVSDGKPYTSGDPRLMLYPARREFDINAYLTDLEKVEKGVYELELKEGSYDLHILHLGEGFSDKKLYDIEVAGGSTVEKTIEVGGTGRLRINLLAGGRPYHIEGRIMVFAAETDYEEYVCDLEETEKGAYEQKLREGSYDLELINLGEGFANRKIRDVEIVGGSTTEKTLELGGTGRLRINLLAGGRPYHIEGRIMVFAAETDYEEYVCDLEGTEKGAYEQKLREGSYDLELINLGEGFANKKIRDVEVVGGSTTEKTLELGGIGRIQVRLIGEEDYEWIRVMLYSADEYEYICDLETDDSGRWAAKVREGEYDLEITNGFNNQWLRGLIVEPGTTLEKTITLDLGDEEDEDW